MTVDLHQELEAKLRDTRTEWQHRLDAIGSDRRRKNAPLEQDFAEQATQRENDETLDALDERGRRALEAIDAALSRLEEGTFGDCLHCGESIDPQRLQAEPTAASCIECAKERDRR